MAQRRELPVQDGDDAGLRRVEHEVVDPEVPVDDGDAVGHDAAAGGGELPQVADDLGEALDLPCVFGLCACVFVCACFCFVNLRQQQGELIPSLRGDV